MNENKCNLKIGGTVCMPHLTSLRGFQWHLLQHTPCHVSWAQLTFWRITLNLWWFGRTLALHSSPDNRGIDQPLTKVLEACASTLDIDDRGKLIGQLLGVFRQFLANPALSHHEVFFRGGDYNVGREYDRSSMKHHHRYGVKLEFEVKGPPGCKRRRVERDKLWAWKALPSASAYPWAKCDPSSSF